MGHVLSHGNAPIKVPVHSLSVSLRLFLTARPFPFHQTSHPYSQPCQSLLVAPGPLSQEVGWEFLVESVSGTSQTWIWQCLTGCSSSVPVFCHFEKKEELGRESRAIPGWLRRKISFSVPFFYGKGEEINQGAL